MIDDDLILETARLDLIATTVEHLECELESPEKLGPMLGAVVPASWPPGLYDRDAMSFFHGKLTEGGAAAAGWYGWYAVLRANDGVPAMLVANGGYMGPPSDGTVEIGYSVVPEMCGRGIASELAAALVARAFATAGVERVIADSHETNFASHKVLERCGFERAGAGREPGHYRFARARETGLK